MAAAGRATPGARQHRGVPSLDSQDQGAIRQLGVSAASGTASFWIIPKMGPPSHTAALPSVWAWRCVQVEQV